VTPGTRADERVRGFEPAESRPGRRRPGISRALELLQNLDPSAVGNGGAQLGDLGRLFEGSCFDDRGALEVALVFGDTLAVTTKPLEVFIP
jgi:hypothetical protein